SPDCRGVVASIRIVSAKAYMPYSDGPRFRARYTAIRNVIRALSALIIRLQALFLINVDLRAAIDMFVSHDPIRNAYRMGRASSIAPTSIAYSSKLTINSVRLRAR